MVFNSIAFALFLPLVFLLYWFVFKPRAIQNTFILAASLLFYGWWDWRFLGLLLFSSSIDYWVARQLDNTTRTKRRKLLLAITLVSNLGILGFFKYFSFFVDTLALLLQTLHINTTTTTLHIILPIGISFYTFQSIAYVVDVYRGQLKSCNNYITFMAFVSFFPQLVAGPISRAQHLLTQFYTPRSFNYQVAANGLRFILYGLLKKVVIADNLARLVDTVYNNPAGYHGIQTLVATLFFAVQIYCDFSGYSDIAVGVARLFGFNLVRNFRTPYFSTSLRQFWQRWHISLSTWFRDYLYIPLGGNRVTEGRRYYNLFITFLVSGLWHGASFSFVIWGGLHGSLLVAGEFFKKHTRIKLPAVFNWLFTITIVCFAWIFFRAKNMHDAGIIIESLGNGWQWAPLTQLLQQVYHSAVFTALLLSVTAMFFLLEANMNLGGLPNILIHSSRPLKLLIYYTIIVLIVFVGLNDGAPNFIYFKF